jgi:hypothetical protein
MIHKICTIAAATALLAAPLAADFSYEQTTKITGGAMVAMMRVAGAFSKQAREPIKQTIIVKGDRMVTIGTDSAHIIDLGKETITDVNFKNRTYSVITFAQMQQAMAAMQAKMQSQKGAEGADVGFSAKVKETGQTKVITGLTAKEVLLILEMEAKDRESGQQGKMEIVADMWLAPKIPGYDEVREFQKRMAAKLAWAPGGAGMMGQSQPGMAKGMAELSKEAAKLDGVPVLQITRMGSSAQAMSDFSTAGQQQAQPEGPSAREAAGNAAGRQAESSAGSAIAGRLGRLGRFGGLGRRKQESQEQEAQQQQQQAQQQAAGTQAQGGQGMLMETTTELTGFSSAPADASKFEVPAGFKQIENEMLKQMKK